MKVESQRVLKAGNEHALRPVIVLTLAEAVGLTLSAEAARALGTTLPPLRADVLDFPGWWQLAATEDPVPITAVVEVLAVAVQRYVFWPVSFCGWRPAPAGSERQGAAEGRAVFEIGTRKAGLAASKAAVALAAALLEEQESQELRKAFDREMKVFLKATLEETPYPDALGVAKAAGSCGIPWSVLPGTSYLRLGSGRFAHILAGTATTKTSIVSARLASSKRLTTSLLAAAGLPVPAQRTVRKEEDAMAAAQAVGFPLVVKPNSGNMGRAVSIGVRDEAELRAAVRRAQAVSTEVVIEALIPGKEYRLLVVGGRFVAASHRRPAQVRGDSSATVRELVEKVNTHPERERLLSGARARRKPLVLDADALALLDEQGLSPDAVPDEGQTVLLRRQSNISQGGDSVDVTDQVHPSVREMAKRAAALLKIDDICGVDYLTTDISQAPWETGGGICEVNTQPGLSSHTMPSEGSVQDVYGAILEMLFPEGTPSRCPVVVLLEPDEGARKLRRAIEKAAAQAERRLGVVLAPEGASAEGATLLPTSLRLNDVEAFDWDGGIDGAILEASAGEVAVLGLDRIDLAVVPASGGVTTLARAGRALALIAADRVVSTDDPEALRRALKALDLPTVKAEAAPGIASEVVVTLPLATLPEPDALLTQKVELLRDALEREREAVADLRRRLDQEQEERRTLQHQLAPPTQPGPQPAQEAPVMVEELRRRLEASEAHIRTLVTSAPPAEQAGEERPGRPSTGVPVEPSRGFLKRLLGLRRRSPS